MDTTLFWLMDAVLLWLMGMVLLAFVFVVHDQLKSHHHSCMLRQLTGCYAIRVYTYEHSTVADIDHPYNGDIAICRSSGTVFIYIQAEHKWRCMGTYHTFEEAVDFVSQFEIKQIVQLK